MQLQDANKINYLNIVAYDEAHLNEYENFNIYFRITNKVHIQ